jgi:hypothetical protein
MQRQWIFPSLDGDEAVGRLSNELSVPLFLASVLMRNGLGDFNAPTFRAASSSTQDLS